MKDSEKKNTIPIFLSQQIKNIYSRLMIKKSSKGKWFSSTQKKENKSKANQSDAQKQSYYHYQLTPVGIKTTKYKSWNTWWQMYLYFILFFNLRDDNGKKNKNRWVVSKRRNIKILITKKNIQEIIKLKKAHDRIVSFIHILALMSLTTSKTFLLLNHFSFSWLLAFAGGTRIRGHLLT